MRTHRLRTKNVIAAGLLGSPSDEEARAKAGRAIDQWVSGLSMESYQVLTTLDMKRLRAAIERALKGEL